MEKDKEQIEFGKRIKAARESAKLTQYQLHNKTGISITQISAYENGNRSVGLQSLSKIAVATNKTMDEIYFGPKEKRPIAQSINKGQLIVNCVSALVDEGVITLVPEKTQNNYVPIGLENYYHIGFLKYVSLIDELVSKLVDFNEHKKDYPDPDNFKKQLLVATSKQINSSK